FKIVYYSGNKLSKRTCLCNNYHIFEHIHSLLYKDDLSLLWNVYALYKVTDLKLYND
ncbi:hypothetical protein L9F63_023993, partial [Diploptera punctata]